MGVRLVLRAGFTRNWFAHQSPADRQRDDASPSLEQTLHFALAAIVIVGWALVYTTLMRGIDRSDVARNDRAGVAVSSNVGPSQTPIPSQTPSIAATPATLRQ